LNKTTSLFIFLFSYSIFASEHHIFQLGKTFVPKMSDDKVQELKNSRGRFIKKKVKKEKLKSIKIKQGDTLVFHNKDDVVHNVFGTDFNFHQEKNSVNKKSFDKKGTKIIRCAIHPKMKIKVTIE